VGLLGGIHPARENLNETVMQPETKYAKSGEVSIAYQVIGNGPLDLVYVPGWVSHLEYAWEEPSLAHFYQRLASFSRLILFDKRGTGLSDRVPQFPTMEQRMDDVRAVMDAVGSERAAVVGASEGGSMCILFAATYPERTSALIGIGIFAKRIWAPDYPWAPTPEQRQKFFDAIRSNWGDVVDLEVVAPSRAADERFRQWWSGYLRRSASPGAALELARWNTDIDVTHVLPAIRVPTLILHRRGDLDANIAEGRYIAQHIPGAKFVELPGSDHLAWVGDSDNVLDEIEEFVTGVRPAIEPDRILATVLFTDIVDSTRRLTDLGDRPWRDLLDAHDAIVQREVKRFYGKVIESTGDGFLGTFDGPARAVRCAFAIRDEVRRLGLEIRAGLHTGEIELRETGIGGIAVHIAARVSAKAGAGEVWVSRTVKELVAGSGLQFSEQGVFALKGVPEEWPLFSVNL
jgi:pimeloyl-ACP methyl ester carboxylesterase/plasmid stabilization system protein ParE